MTGHLPCFIYAIEAENGLVKIGRTNNPQQRAKSVFAGSPVKTRLIIAIPGLRRHEGELHRLFRTHCEWYEWFRIEGAVRRFVEEHRGRGVGPIPEWSDICPAEIRSRRDVAYAKRKSATVVRLAAKKQAAA